VYWQEDCG
jgi:hypothetical protein